MNDLIERIEAASAPDREIDLLIMRYAENIGGPAENALPYTESVDAALTLVPEGEFWKIGNDGEGADPSDYAAAVTCTWWPNGRKASPHMRTLRATATTPALALSAAALKSRAYLKETNNVD